MMGAEDIPAAVVGVAIRIVAKAVGEAVAGTRVAMARMRARAMTGTMPGPHQPLHQHQRSHQLLPPHLWAAACLKRVQTCYNQYCRPVLL